MMLMDKKDAMNKVYFIVIGLLGELIISCGGHGKRVDEALTLAGDNRGELESVLDHYKEDAPKLEAARFLVGNMPGCYGVNPKLKEECRPFYDAYDSLACAYGYRVGMKWGKKVDSLWNRFSSLHLNQYNSCNDPEWMKARQLIGEIELSFRAWKENVYSQDCSFEDFCEYVLPYRRMNGLLIDSARHVFYARHHGKYFAHAGKNWQQEIDSLLYEYRYLTHSGFWGTGIPLWDAGTFEELRHGLCSQRCWYNSLLLSSLGMPVAVDYVPAWANRNSSHTWNVVMIGGKSYAFEAFWDNDRWKYKRIYNNRTKDELWGKFRLPKVYRHTYSNHIEGPLADPEVNRGDIPRLFRSIKKMDVSDEYFETQDVTVELTREIPAGARYAYLAVFGYQDWHVVQWGKIENGKALFRKMGKDIVYLPVYYVGGRGVPAASPFMLESDGVVRELLPGKKTEKVALRVITGAPVYNGNTPYMGCMRGSRIVGLHEEEMVEELCTWKDSLALERTYQPVNAARLYRYVRLLLPSENIALGELSFYTDEGRIEHSQVLTSLEPVAKNETPGMLTDGLDATAYRGKAASRTVDIDLGKESRLTRIGMSPYIRSEVFPTETYELLYWQNGWVPLERKPGGDNGYIVFENAPQNALFMLKNCRWKGKTAERIFLYKEGEVQWQ